MKTVEIATNTGTETRKARKTCVPGLVITGERGLYSLTHTASGKRMFASTFNYNAKLEQIENAVFLAQSVGQVDWTVSETQLPNKKCAEWYRRFGSALSHS